MDDDVARGRAVLTAGLGFSAIQWRAPILPPRHLARDVDEVVERLTALRDAIPEVEPLVVEVPGLFTEAELREARWRAEGAEEVRR